MSTVLIADKLRASLLQAAIQGKLTKQLPEDGDARDLLKEIEAERTRLIEEKIIRKEKPLPPITDEEIPFEIPKNWAWVRLQDIFHIVRGGSPRPIQQFLTTNEDGVNWIKIGDTDIGGKYISEVREKIIPEGVKSSRFVRKGGLLLTNSMSYGRPYILKVDGCIHDGWLAFSPYVEGINKEFFYYLLSSSFIKNQFNSSVSGAVVKNLNRDKVKEILVALPSLEEQNRIVEAIEIVLAKIDKLKTDEDKLDKIQKALPNKLRSALLQSAIQGKLTEQLPTDGDACDLLKEIEAEKTRMIEEKIIRKEKPLLPITEDEIPFEIPENWAWVRLGDVTNYGIGKQIAKQNIDRGSLIVELEDIEKNTYQLLQKRYDRNPGSSKNHFNSNNVLYGKLRPYLKKCIVIDSTGYCSTEIIPIKGYAGINPHFIKYYMTSPYMDNTINDLTYGMDMPRLGTKDAINLIMPLPPLAEQQRIVDKLNEILDKINQLGEV